MINRRHLLELAAALAGSAALNRFAVAAPSNTPESGGAPTGRLKVARFIDTASAELQDGEARAIVRTGDRFGIWTVMEILGGELPCVVLEDFRGKDGHLLFVNLAGVALDLPKSLETTAAAATPDHLGHSTQQVTDSAHDLLAEQILGQRGDPDYAEVERAFAPIQKVSSDCYSFVGTPQTQDKIGFTYGGRTANFDPAVYQPSIELAVKSGQVWNGLVGGYLPVLRFVFPDADQAWTEYLAFAPFRVVNGNLRFQPVWYRVSRIVAGALQWTRHFDSYHPFPSRPSDDPRRFYADLAGLKAGWDQLLQPAMKISLPDPHLENLVRFSLVRALMSRSAGYPKYGAVEKNYGGSEHDGFQDTFTVETEAMNEWGLTERAGQYIENYFQQSVTDEGSIVYRGPETGQYGRMLTVAAQFVAAGGDGAVLLRCRARLDAVTRLLLELRAKALRRPPDDTAIGMIAGWSEADSCLEKDPQRYVQPYFSNSTEAARGLRDLGRVWQSIGEQQGDAELQQWGLRLIGEAAALRRDLALATARSLLTLNGERILPSIAGVTEPAHVVVKRDPLDPQYRGYRAYMEMMHSGNLSAEQIGLIADYRAHHFDTLLGVPTAYGYNTREMAGFLSYGHGYGLIQIDRIREALLLTYSLMAHQYTRGTWLAPETRRPMASTECAPYCSPAQLAVPLLLRWLLVFEDPESETLWLGKGIPSAWLTAGRRTTVSEAPTRWGRIGYTISCAANRGPITASVHFPQQGIAAETRLRIRAGLERRMLSVWVNGKRWKQFDPASEIITLPPQLGGMVSVSVRYAVG
jgi:hypothetical protein